MKIFVLNGSPRLNGNTRTALNSIIAGIERNYSNPEIEIFDVSKLKLSGCTNCDGCKSNGGNCVLPDDSAHLINKIYEADILILGTPVYWWGVSAQLKMVIDKFYSKVEQFQSQKKKVGIVSVGGDGPSNPQYGLITKQMECIFEYLGWNLVFSHGIAAYAKNELADNARELKKLEELSENFR